MVRKKGINVEIGSRNRDYFVFNSSTFTWCKYSKPGVINSIYKEEN